MKHASFFHHPPQNYSRGNAYWWRVVAPNRGIWGASSTPDTNVNQLLLLAISHYWRNSIFMVATSNDTTPSLPLPYSSSLTWLTATMVVQGSRPTIRGSHTRRRVVSQQQGRWETRVYFAKLALIGGSWLKPIVETCVVFQPFRAPSLQACGAKLCQKKIGTLTCTQPMAQHKLLLPPQIERW
jgi:hypothetical protein